MKKLLLIKIIDKLIKLYSDKIEVDKDFRKFAKNSCHFIMCGHVSGYKPCCIAFFTFVWHPNVGTKYDKINKIWVKPGFMNEMFRKSYLYINGFGFECNGEKNNRGYIACPMCILTGQYTKTIMCPCSDKKGNRPGANEHIPIWYLKNLRAKLDT